MVTRVRNCLTKISMNCANKLLFLLAGANIQHIYNSTGILFCFFYLFFRINFNLLRTRTLKYKEILLVITLFAHNICMYVCMYVCIGKLGHILF
jgi:hypothetical protein